MIRKSVIVTGASGDIGFAISKKFAEKGYNIIATYNSGNLDNLKETCKRLNVELFEIKIDLEDANSIENGFKKAFSSMPYIDSIICNAGACEDEVLLCDMTREQINKLLDTNLKGTIICNREAMKYLIKQKHGSIINISSIYGQFGGACESVYSATKAGIIGLTKALALECAPYEIRVNAVAPGFIETKMTSCFNEEEKKNIKNLTPLKRLGKSEDVANVVYFLASEDSSFITGETITVSGGALRF